MKTGKTVAALSTPQGRGAIALIRMTGEDAVKIACSVFKPKARMPLYAFEPRTAVYGVIMQGGDIIDDGVAVVYKAPSSYTGEDMVELSCHGGVLVTRLVLQALYEAGAYPADGGEFTKRAFINGKLGLCEAEAIMDVIDAKSRSALKLANASGRALLGGEIARIYASMRSLAAGIYAYIDYPDEDLSDVTPESMENTLCDISKSLEKLIASYDVKKAVGVGIDTVICGKPNVGKSSLLNALSGEEVAIVTSVAGTTRDIVTNTVSCGDAVLNLCDTAGIHGTEDEVEAIGIDRAVKRMEKCSLALAVFDASRPLDDEDVALVETLGTLSCTKLAVINKCDIGGVLDTSLIEKSFEHTLRISTMSGEGIEELKKLVEELFLSGGIDYTEPHIANARQLGETMAAKESIENAIGTIRDGYSVDIAAIELFSAMESLGRVDGTGASEDVVGEIFSKFCVGK